MKIDSSNTTNLSKNLAVIPASYKYATVKYDIGVDSIPKDYAATILPEDSSGDQTTVDAMKEKSQNGQIKKSNASDEKYLKNQAEIIEILKHYIKNDPKIIKIIENDLKAAKKKGADKEPDKSKEKKKLEKQQSEILDFLKKHVKKDIKHTKPIKGKELVRLKRYLQDSPEVLDILKNDLAEIDNPVESGTLSINQEPVSLIEKVKGYIRQSSLGGLLLDLAQKLNIPINISNDLPEMATGVTHYGPTRIEIAPDSLENMVETLTHELVHAVTAGDGDSIQEEIYATVTAEAVSSEIGLNENPRTLDDINVWAYNGPLYAGLEDDNGIVDDLVKKNDNWGLGSKWSESKRLSHQFKEMFKKF